MTIKRSGDGCEPPYLDRTNQRHKAAPIPLPNDYAAVLAGSPGPAHGAEMVAKGPSYSTANFRCRKDS